MGFRNRWSMVWELACERQTFLLALRRWGTWRNVCRSQASWQLRTTRKTINHHFASLVNSFSFLCSSDVSQLFENLRQEGRQAGNSSFILTPRKKENMTPHEFIALYRFPVISKYYCGSVMTIYKEVISASVCIHFLFLCCWRRC